MVIHGAQGSVFGAQRYLELDSSSQSNPVVQSDGNIRAEGLQHESKDGEPLALHGRINTTKNYFDRLQIFTSDVVQYLLGAEYPDRGHAFHRSAIPTHLLPPVDFPDDHVARHQSPIGKTNLQANIKNMTTTIWTKI